MFSILPIRYDYNPHPTAFEEAFGILAIGLPIWGIGILAVGFCEKNRFWYAYLVIAFSVAFSRSAALAFIYDKNAQGTSSGISYR